MTKKNLILIILVIFILGFGLWFYSLRSSKPGDVVVSPVIRKSDNPAQISKDVESVEIKDLDTDFQAIDADLNSL